MSGWISPLRLDKTVQRATTWIYFEHLLKKIMSYGHLKDTRGKFHSTSNLPLEHVGDLHGTEPRGSRDIITRICRIIITKSRQEYFGRYYLRGKGRERRTRGETRNLR